MSIQTVTIAVLKISIHGIPTQFRAYTNTACSDIFLNSDDAIKSMCKDIKAFSARDVSLELMFGPELLKQCSVATEEELYYDYYENNETEIQFTVEFHCYATCSVFIE